MREREETERRESEGETEGRRDRDGQSEDCRDVKYIFTALLLPPLNSSIPLEYG